MEEWETVAARASLRTEGIRESRAIIEEMALSDDPTEAAIAQETLSELDSLEEKAVERLNRVPDALGAAFDLAEMMDGLQEEKK